ncbi:DUF4810 domain-containing protein [Thermaurantiacus sp.]
MIRAVALGLALGAAACATPESLYHWGNYNRIALLEARGSLSDREYAEALLAIISAAEAKNKVPPGLYAEYGFALLALGNRASAADWFGKERAKWPESAVFMDRLIAVAMGDVSPAPLSARQPAAPGAPPQKATPAAPPGKR